MTTRVHNTRASDAIRTEDDPIAVDAIYQGIAPFLNSEDIIIPHRCEQGNLTETQVIPSAERS